MEDVLDILVVNINNLAYTKNLLKDIKNQDTNQFRITIVDQGSTEPGTSDWLNFMDELSPMLITIIRNDSNVSLNQLWNNHFEKSESNYLCFLNNDMRIPRNFVSDTLEIFELEPTAGVVVHATNHPDFNKPTDLDYVSYESRFCQGWDFSIRREAYTRVPPTLDTFGGDEYIYWHMYEAGWKAMVAISSPVIHYHAKSRQYFEGDRDTISKKVKELVPERMPYYNNFTRRKPCPAQTESFGTSLE